jgi:hypothetical protein
MEEIEVTDRRERYRQEKEETDPHVITEQTHTTAQRQTGRQG